MRAQGWTDPSIWRRGVGAGHWAVSEASDIGTVMDGRRPDGREFILY